MVQVAEQTAHPNVGPRRRPYQVRSLDEICRAAWISRLMLGDEFRTTELHKDARSVQGRADEWRSALLERGWR